MQKNTNAATVGTRKKSRTYQMITVKKDLLNDLISSALWSLSLIDADVVVHELDFKKDEYLITLRQSDTSFEQPNLFED